MKSVKSNYLFLSETNEVIILHFLNMSSFQDFFALNVWIQKKNLTLDGIKSIRTPSLSQDSEKEPVLGGGAKVENRRATKIEK